jgi:hypothetical protein
MTHFVQIGLSDLGIVNEVDAHFMLDAELVINFGLSTFDRFNELFNYLDHYLSLLGPTAGASPVRRLFGGSGARAG